MTEFNLLPWREERRRERYRQFKSQLGLAALLGLVIVLAVYVLNDRHLATQRERRQWLSTEIARLDLRIGEIRRLKEMVANLLARRDAVASLQQVRATPVRFLDELSKQIPEGVMLKSVLQAERISLTGFAQSGARVSEFLRVLASLKSVSNPELVEIKAATLGQAREAKRVFEFSIAMNASTPTQESR